MAAENADCCAHVVEHVLLHGGRRPRRVVRAAAWLQYCSQTIARGSTYQSLAAFHKLAVEEDMPRVWKSAACAAVRHDDSPRWRVDDASRDHAKGGAHERRTEPGEGGHEGRFQTGGTGN